MVDVSPINMLLVFVQKQLTQCDRKEDNFREKERTSPFQGKLSVIILNVFISFCKSSSPSGSKAPKGSRSGGDLRVGQRRQKVSAVLFSVQHLPASGTLLLSRWPPGLLPGPPVQGASCFRRA